MFKSTYTYLKHSIYKTNKSCNKTTIYLFFNGYSGANFPLKVPTRIQDSRLLKYNQECDTDK